jgi:transcription termination/antitermination protein NusG
MIGGDGVTSNGGEKFKAGDRVRVTEGTFENYRGVVNQVGEKSDRITVVIDIFGRSAPVELEHWQLEIW